LIATSEEATERDFETVLRKVIKDLRKQIEDKPEHIRPVTASAILPTTVPQRQPEQVQQPPLARGVREAPHRFITQVDQRPGQFRRDIEAMARSAVAIGRDFIY
jgi:hypothetical protein